MTPQLINTSKGKIEYTITGQGIPILFVHGGHVNCRETIFRKGLDLNKFCCITPSRPGYGNTPLSDSNKSPKGTADLFIALLEELDYYEVIVIGISAGGLTALEIAAHNHNSTLILFRNHWGHLLWIGIDYELILDEVQKYIEE